jgi:hypothetical protein
MKYAIEERRVVCKGEYYIAPGEGGRGSCCKHDTEGSTFRVRGIKKTLPTLP